MKAGLNHQRIAILGSSMSVLKREEIEKRLIAEALQGLSGYVCIANVHTTMTGYFDSKYREITNSSSYSVPDGVPLVWAMRSLGAANQDRVRGPSLMKKMLELGQDHGIRHYLYGGSPAALEALKNKIRQDYPRAIVVGAESPPFRPIEALTQKDWQEAADRINETRPHFIWIGLGAPKQERWAWEQRNRIRGIQFAIGAAFDLLPGRVPEAPQWMQDLGLEWLYRFLKEPKRLWRRYILNNPLFLILWCVQWISAKLFRRKYLCESKPS